MVSWNFEGMDQKRKKVMRTSPFSIGCTPMLEEKPSHASMPWKGQALSSTGSYLSVSFCIREQDNGLAVVTNISCKSDCQLVK